MNQPTSIQKRIENMVAGKAGYDPTATSRIPYELMNTPIGPQLALLNMDLRDDKITWDSAIFIGCRIQARLSELEEKGFPLGIITSPEGLNSLVEMNYMQKGPGEFVKLSKKIPFGTPENYPGLYFYGRRKIKKSLCDSSA